MTISITSNIKISLVEEAWMTNRSLSNLKKIYIIYKLCVHLLLKVNTTRNIYKRKFYDNRYCF